VNSTLCFFSGERACDVSSKSSIVPWDCMTVGWRTVPHGFRRNNQLQRVGYLEVNRQLAMHVLTRGCNTAGYLSRLASMRSWSSLYF
jgi:hypothetical protein